VFPILPGPFIMAGPVPALAQVAADTAAPVACGQGAPPALLTYAQPPMPEEGYMWTPGYWQWAATGYFWIPGTWVEPPSLGVLWTPPYWAFAGGIYGFHAGYWGSTVGFYGGVNYGFGYGGSGFDGGRWDGGHFAYNRSVTNFGSVHVTNAYRQNVSVNTSHISFNGGVGGVRAEASAGERESEHESHASMTSQQTLHETAAAGHPGLVASHNNGRPAIAATSRPAQFEGRGVVQPRQAYARPEQMRGQQARPMQQAESRAAPQRQAAHQEGHRER
jgi:hypothetical protein